MSCLNAFVNKSHFVLHTLNSMHHSNKINQFPPIFWIIWKIALQCALNYDLCGRKLLRRPPGDPHLLVFWLLRNPLPLECHLLLTSRIWQKWWDCPSKIRWQYDFCLAYSRCILSLSPLLTLKEASCHAVSCELRYGEVHVARNWCLWQPERNWILLTATWVSWEAHRPPVEPSNETRGHGQCFECSLVTYLDPEATNQAIQIPNLQTPGHNKWCFSC